MLSSLLLYLLFISAGILVGSKVLKKDREYGWIGKLQMAALLILIFTMGVKIGADERVLSSIGTLGVKAFVITVCAVAGSVLCVSAGRRLMKLDKKGKMKTDGGERR